MDYLPKSIQKFIDETPVSKIIKWLVAVFTFYVMPRRFFLGFFKQSTKDQVKQGVLYIAVFILFFCLFSGFNKWDNVKLVIGLFLLSLPISIIQYVIARLLKLPRKQCNRAFPFTFISFMLLQLPVLLLSYLFLINEDYTLLLWSNTLAVISQFFVVFFFWHTLSIATKKVAFAYFLSFVFVNIAVLIFVFFRVPGGDSNGSSDPIIGEIEYHLRDIKDYDGVPFTRTITYVRGVGDFDSLTVRHNDTLTHYGKDGVELYKKIAETNSRKLDSILKKVHFKKAKSALSSLQRYYYLMSGYFDYHPCDTCLVNSNTWTDTVRHIVVKKSNLYVVDSTYLKSFYEFQRKNNQLVESANMAEVPGRFTSILIFPDILLLNWLGKTPLHINTQLLKTED
jgi:hypothetical protein